MASCCRWNMLHCALGEIGVQAAPTKLPAAGNCAFPAVGRFDYRGLTGWIGMLSAGSVDDEFFGLRDTLREFAMNGRRGRRR
jgi:hypothetical protein